MQLLGVRRAEIVDEVVGMLDEAHGIDDERVALVTADPFAEPGRFWIGAVGHVHHHAAHVMVALPDDVDDLRRLDEIDRLGREQQLRRSAAGPATRLRDEAALFAFVHEIVVLPHACARGPTA